MERDKFVAGEFVWTGFDYLGEPTPFDRQAASSYFGIVDTCGIPKDRFYLYRSLLAARYADGPHSAALELARPRRPERAGVRLHQRRQRGAVPQRQVARPAGKEQELFAAREHRRRQTVDRQLGRASAAAKTRRRTTATMAIAARRWVAASGGKNEWWQIDLGGVEPVADVVLSTEGNAGDFLYRIDVSDDGKDWRTVVNHDKWYEGWGDQFTHGVNTDARFIRVTFTDLRNDARAVVRDFAVYPQSYYAVTDKYRLRWMDVPYEPGELKAVAYKDGKQIGEAVMKTAGAPAAIRLTPDRTKLASTGDDLCYVLVEALDADGNLCPLADNSIEFKIDGPATIAGVGNGDPLSIEAYQEPHRQLFYGKALLIVRPDEGPGGTIGITSQSAGLAPGAVSIESGTVR